MSAQGRPRSETGRSRRRKDTHCSASRGCKDPDDDNRDCAVVITYSTDKIVFVVVYDGWEWEKADDILKAEFATDKTTS